MVNLNDLLLSTGHWIESNGLWEKLIGWFNGKIGNIGWTIVIFTILLKLALIPLDIYQRRISAKTTEKQKEMQPELDKIKRIYGNDQNMLNQKTMEVYKAHNFNIGSSCFGLLINMVLTIVIFFTLFGSIRNITQFMIYDEYAVLRETYGQAYNAYNLSDETTGLYTNFKNIYLIDAQETYNEIKKNHYIDYYASFYQKGINEYNNGVNYLNQLASSESKTEEQYLLGNSYESRNQWLVSVYFNGGVIDKTILSANSSVDVAIQYASQEFETTTAQSLDAYKEELKQKSYIQFKEKNNTNAQNYIVEKMKHQAKMESAQQVTLEKYEEIKESWLWIKNIYLTDTATSPFPKFDTFISNSQRKYDGYSEQNKYQDIYLNTATNADTAKELERREYNDVTALIQQDVAGTWNGFYILIVLSGLITFLSMKITRMGQPKQTQKIKMPDGTEVEKEVGGLGVLSLLMPILMVYFTFSYTGLFALYIVINSLMSVIISLVSQYVRKFLKNRKSKNNVAIATANGSDSHNGYRLNNKYTIIEEPKQK